jgi:beta-1,2-mannobiose phosphorylase / 1,2-beta-oligomannan phosphorylase
MTIKIKRDEILIKPIDIKPSSKDFEIIGTINPAATKLPNGDIILYVRVIEKLKKYEDENYVYSPRMIGKNKFEIKLDKFSKKNLLDESSIDFTFKDDTKRFNYLSHFRKVILDKDGFTIKSIDKKPSFFGVSWNGELGVEDPRITKINDLYVMTYVALSRSENVSTSYAISNDCINWYKRGVIFSEENKDAVIFPEIIREEYFAFNRPVGGFHFSLPHIWISSSKDLEYWGKPKPITLARKGDWDYGKNGAGPPPIRTDKGWLLLYHSVVDKEEMKREIRLLDKLRKLFGKESEEEIEKTEFYSVGAALFDLNNPRKLIAKTDSPLILPLKDYEQCTLENKKVVFPTGLVVDSNNKDLIVYLGAGDLVTTVKKISLKEILDSLKML